jgi:uncharacterized coiled-coil DUF342 family protein
MSRFKDPLEDIRKSLALMSDPLREHRERMALISDPMKELRSSLDLMSDPLKEHRERMDSISDPMKSLRESLALVPDPLKEHREMLASISDPMKDLRASLDLMSDPLKEHGEMMDSISDPMKGLRESMALMSDPLKKHREMMESFSNPMKDLRTSLKHLSDPFSEIQNTLLKSSSLKSMRDIALEVQSDIEIDKEGFVSLSSKRIIAADLQELSNTIFQSSSITESRSLEESINNLIDEIKAQKDPLTQKILIYFVYPLIIIVIASFLNPIVDHYVQPYLNSDKRVLAKELKARVNSAVDNKELLNTFRFVSADILNVRSSPSVKSEIIGNLRFSSSVMVIEKRKNWTLIEWNNPETDAEITGWVFSRYLVKFR